MSIYSYDKEANCTWCRYSAEKERKCPFGLEEQDCDKYKYDVFKRIPRQSPKLRDDFDEEDFNF